MIICGASEYEKLEGDNHLARNNGGFPDIAFHLPTQHADISILMWTG
jgi:hypothetical protein